MATRLCRQQRSLSGDGRKPHASINFITCHDGFTLQDFVSYNNKHNEANGEENRDGTNDNNSWNCGVEGPTEDPAIIALREKQKRNLFATLVFSQGVPMILGGDELSHTQKGNNNTYCQDNDLTWLHWELDERQQKFLAFVKKVIRIWWEQPVFQRRKFFKGRAIRGTDIKDISFLNPSGQEMTDEDWNAGFTQCIGVRLAGDLIDDEDDKGQPIVGDTLLLLLNAHHEPIPFTLPLTKVEQCWEAILDTAEDGGTDAVFTGQQPYPLEDRSLAILRTRSIEDKGAVSNATVEAAVQASHPPLSGRPPLD